MFGSDVASREIITSLKNNTHLDCCDVITTYLRAWQTVNGRVAVHTWKTKVSLFLELYFM